MLYTNFIKGLIVFLLLLPFVFAIDTSNNFTILGDPLDSQGVITSSVAIGDVIVDIQFENAEGQSQLATDKTIFEVKKKFLFSQADKGWDIIIAFFKLIIETIILLIYILEMRIILYLLVQLIPSLFIKLKDRLSNFILVRIK